MAIKESSDELNPAVTTAPAVGRRAHSLKDYLALAIATCGVGFFPIAPGTLGSLVGVGVYFLLESFTFRLLRLFAVPNFELRFSAWSVFLSIELTVITVVTLVGIWAASRTEKLAGRKDPGKVVIDEVAGQLIALLPVFARFDPGWVNVIFAFLLFRFFDIIKPYPARRLESLESGLGIVADDLVAGAYAAVAVSLFVIIRWLI
ncbi:MAG TPA: phosphatidylglycerophosphatase A [Pyrinomonadaceae bacterium]